MKSLARRRRRLWEKDPHCHWCGVKTVWVKGHIGKRRPDEATIDHLYPKYHPKRHERNNEIRTVLACNRCNNERGQVFLDSLGKEFLYSIGAGKPLGDHSLEEIKKIEEKILRTLQSHTDKLPVTEFPKKVRLAINKCQKNLNNIQTEIIRRQSTCDYVG